MFSLVSARAVKQQEAFRRAVKKPTMKMKAGWVLCCLLVPALGADRHALRQPFLSAASSGDATPSSSSTTLSGVSSGAATLSSSSTTPSSTTPTSTTPTSTRTTSGSSNCAICLNTMLPARFPEDEQKDDNTGSDPEAIVMDQRNWQWTCCHWKEMCGACAGTTEVMELCKCPICRNTEVTNAARHQSRDQPTFHQDMEVPPSQQRMDLQPGGHPLGCCGKLCDCCFDCCDRCACCSDCCQHCCC